MIQLLMEYKYIVLANVILFYFLHVLVVKPLLGIRSYIKQGIEIWGFFPLMGPQILEINRDVKKYNDVIYSQKIIHHSPKGTINASVSNVLSSPSLILYDPYLIQDFYQYKNQYYVKSSLGQTLTDVLFGKGLIFSEGEQWKKARSIASKLFTFHENLNYIPMIEDITNFSLSSIKPGDKTDLLSILENITGTFSLSIFFGRTLEGETLQGESLVKFIKDTQSRVLKQFLNPLFVLSVQGGKYISKEFRNKANAIKEKMRKLVKDEIQSQWGNKNSLIVLYAKEYHYLGGEPRQDLVEDITNQILSFYAAGRDTTSHMVQMMMYYIAKDDSLSQKLLDEFGNLKGPIQWDNIRSLPIMEAVINETLRIYGPTIGIMAREATQTHKLGNITVTKGTYVQIGMPANNHHPIRFPDPFTFNYERWLNKNPLTDQYQFIPFSAGARNCIGQHLAKITTKVMVLNILRKYDVQVDPEYKLKFVFTQTYAPQVPLNFIFQPK